jgi:hypothetical protein
VYLMGLGKGVAGAYGFENCLLSLLFSCHRWIIVGICLVACTSSILFSQAIR